DPDTVVLSTTQISSVVVPFTIKYSATLGTFGQGVRLLLGSGNDIVSVAGTAAGAPTLVDSGAGNDSVNVMANSANSSTVVNTGLGNDTIRVSSASNTLDTFRSPVTIDAGA